MKVVPSMKVGMREHSIKVSHPIVKIRAITERLIPLSLYNSYFHITPATHHIDKNLDFVVK